MQPCQISLENRAYQNKVCNHNSFIFISVVVLIIYVCLNMLFESEQWSFL